MKDRDIHDESNAWSAAQGQKTICGFDVYVGNELNLNH